MKKVLIVFNHPAPYKVRLFNELSKTFDLHVIFERNKASDRNKKFYFEQKFDFIEHKIKGILIGRENIVSCGVKNHIKNNKYDLIIMNGYSQFAEMGAIRYLKKKNIPYALYINGGIINEKESKLKKLIKTKFISGASYYFSPDNESNKYLTYYGAQSDKIFNYPYSTIFEKEIVSLPINKKEIRKSLEISFEKVFVSSGQLIRRKNYLSLVKEWKNFPENYGLYILGEGKQKSKISKFIRENRIKNVVLTGFLPRNKTFEYFKAADAFLFPSKEDIYGHVINEALSQGIPVISTKHVNSATKLITEKKNGFLLKSLSGEELKEAIQYCLENDMSSFAIKTAKQNTIELMSDVHVQLIEKVLK